MNPVKSIKERRKGYVLNHFSSSRYAKELKQFQGIHSGETCFIIGNGPSLSANDLELLYEKKIPTFAFNRIYLIFNQTQWRPTYYVSQDEKTLKNCASQVESMDLKDKFIPLFIRFYHQVEITGAHYFYLKSSNTDYPELTDDISSFIGYTTTVAVTAGQMAAYMGFRKIYLLGVDHSFSTYQNDKGEILQDKNAKDYFTDAYNPDKAELYIPNIDASTRAFISLKQYCDMHGIEVYNATRGGKLEVFPRVSFEEIIKFI